MKKINLQLIVLTFKALTTIAVLFTIVLVLTDVLTNGAKML